MQLYDNAVDFVEYRPVVKYYKYGTKPNALLLGNLTENDGKVSGFSTTAFCIPNTTFYPGDGTWELNLKIKTGSDVSTAQYLNSTPDYVWGPMEIIIKSARFGCNQSKNGSSGSETFGSTYTVLANTEYRLRYEYDGTYYRLSYSTDDGLTYNIEVELLASSLTSYTPIIGYNKMILGNDHGEGANYSYPLKSPGYFDFTGCNLIINGEEVWHGTIAEESDSSDYDFTKIERDVKLPHYLKTHYYKYGNEPNAELVGNITSNNGVISGFSDTAGSESFAVSGIHFYPGTSNWEVDLKIKTGTIGTTQYLYSTYDYLYGPNEIHISTAGHFGIDIYDIPNPSGYPTHEGTYTVLANTDYWLRFIYDGTNYQLWYSLTGEEGSFVKDIDAAPGFTVLGYGTLLLGIDNNGTSSQPFFSSPFKGSIDLHECQISVGNNVIWKGIKAEEATSSDADFSEVKEEHKAVLSRDAVKYTRSTTKPNALMLGNLTEDNGVVSGFSTSAFCIANTGFYPGTKTWEINLKIKTGTNISSTQFVNSSADVNSGPNEIAIESSKFIFALYPNGSSSGISRTGTYTVKANQDYWLRQVYDGTNYYLQYSETGEENDFHTDITIAKTELTIQTIVGYSSFLLGIDHFTSNARYGTTFLGSIDFNGCNIKIDGKTIWNGTITEVSNTPFN